MPTPPGSRPSKKPTASDKEIVTMKFIGQVIGRLIEVAVVVAIVAAGVWLTLPPQVRP
jgi:hypothetical protein